MRETALLLSTRRTRTNVPKSVAVRPPSEDWAFAPDLWVTG
jgi:hypothetical protein